MYRIQQRRNVCTACQTMDGVTGSAKGGKGASDSFCSHRLWAVAPDFHSIGYLVNLSSYVKVSRSEETPPPWYQ